MPERIAVLVVDDSPFVRSAVKRMLAPLDHVRVVGTAANGREAVEEVKRLRPDVVVLDIVMPEVDGLEAIRDIMATFPTPILVLSSHAHPGAEVTLKALDLGAVDFISKTEAGRRMDIYELAPALREKVLGVAGARFPAGSGSIPAEPVTAPSPAGLAPGGAMRSAFPAVAYDVVAVGASTGGPRALVRILSDLPASFPAGIVIAQHMPPGFTETLAQRLDRRSALRVREARDGDRVEPGVALVGVGGRQFRVEQGDDGLRVRIPTGSDRLLHRPSVDDLLSSVARAAGSRAIGVVLTGMGQDGAEGLAEMRRAGARTLAEAEESAVIFGMPRAAGPHAEQVLPLDRIPGAILDLFGAELG